MEALKEQRDIVVGLRVPREGELAAVGGGEDDVDHLQGGHFFEDGAGREAGSKAAGAPTQRGVQGEGEKADEDVGLDAALQLMIDGADAEVAFEIAEGFLYLDELEVALPEFTRVGRGQVRAQQEASLAAAGLTWPLAAMALGATGGAPFR